MKSYKQKFGKLGEASAVEYLVKKKYQIITTNFRCNLGEIDIIAKDNNYIVFIEVKTRRNNNFGLPSEAVNYGKKEKIIKTAEFYILYSNKSNIDIRFDVIEIIGEVINEDLIIKSLNHIENAF